MNPDLFYRNLGGWLRKQRRSVGKSMEDAGDALAYSWQQVQKYELGTTRVPVDRLVILCRLYGVSVASAVAAALGNKEDGHA